MVEGTRRRAAGRMMIRKEQQQLRVRPQLIVTVLTLESVQQVSVMLLLVQINIAVSALQQVKYPSTECAHQKLLLRIYV